MVDEIANNDAEVAVVKQAVMDSIQGMTVYGYKIANYVSDEQVTQVAVAVVAALAEFRQSNDAEGGAT